MCASIQVTYKPGKMILLLHISMYLSYQNTYLPPCMLRMNELTLLSWLYDRFDIYVSYTEQMKLTFYTVFFESEKLKKRVSFTEHWVRLSEYPEWTDELVQSQRLEKKRWWDAWLIMGCESQVEVLFCKMEDILEGKLILFILMVAVAVAKAKQALHMDR